MSFVIGEIVIYILARKFSSNWKWFLIDLVIWKCYSIFDGPFIDYSISLSRIITLPNNNYV